MYYGYAHRSVKWWKRVFFHLIDLSLVNANILHNGKKMTHLDFRIAAATSLLNGYTRPTKRSASVGQAPLRLTERAFPEIIPNNSKPDCKVCSDRSVEERHQTKYRCKTCKTPLCLIPCFEQYHTTLDYKVKYKLTLFMLPCVCVCCVCVCVCVSIIFFMHESYLIEQKNNTHHS